jgi:hypothetical protein
MGCGCGMRRVRPDDEYDSKQLKYGTEVELEHTTNRTLAKTIAKAHLDEYPDYYRELKKMEAKLEKRNGKQRRKK